MLPQQSYIEYDKQCDWKGKPWMADCSPSLGENLNLLHANNKSHRSACTSVQSDQHLCCSLSEEYDSWCYHMPNFNLLNTVVTVVSIAEQTGLSRNVVRKPWRRVFLQPDLKVIKLFMLDSTEHEISAAHKN